MLTGLNEVRRAAELHWACVAATTGLAAWLILVRQQLRGQAIERRQERRIREEIEAYAYLDARPKSDGDLGELARRVCQVVSDKSHFRRVAMLARDADGRLYVAGSVGMEDKIIAGLSDWAGTLTEPENKAGEADRGLRRALGHGIDLGRKSLAVVLGAKDGEVGHTRAIVVPVGTTADRRLVGALVVCAEWMLSVRRRRVEEALAPLETLAVKLGRSMENAVLADRLLRAEKLAGLGLLAGGMAHALNNPLTAVLGFAELIAETAEQPGVQEDAETIRREAQRMRETVESLLNFWRPSVNRDEDVAMTALVRELASACESKLAARGVQLLIQADDQAPPVRGNGDRLRQVLEHLLNNAAQAIASKGRNDAGSEHSIRVTVSHDVRAVQVIVSDTGPGFREPGRVFDPFYTTREPGEGSGLGLSICYGIVREHGGEISAFNLHPRGAAVVVELPVGNFLAQGGEGGAQDAA